MPLIQILFTIQSIIFIIQAVCLAMLRLNRTENRMRLQYIILTGVVITLILGTTLKSLHGL